MATGVLQAATANGGTTLLSGLFIGAGIVTLLLQTITLVGLVWKGGRWSQWMESRHDKLEAEHKADRVAAEEDRREHMEMIARDRQAQMELIERLTNEWMGLIGRVTAQLDKVEERVGKLEGRK